MKKPSTKPLSKMTSEELAQYREDLEYERIEFRQGLFKIQSSLFMLLVFAAVFLRRFVSGWQFVAVVAIAAAALLVNLAFVYRRQITIKTKLRAVNAEISSR